MPLATLGAAKVRAYHARERTGRSSPEETTKRGAAVLTNERFDMRMTHGADPPGRRSSSYSAVSEAIAPARGALIAPARLDQDRDSEQVPGRV